MLVFGSIWLGVYFEILLSIRRLANTQKGLKSGLFIGGLGFLFNSIF
jgi:hypothetical protein